MKPKLLYFSKTTLFQRCYFNSSSKNQSFIRNLTHHIYSPDIAHYYFSLFPKMKSHHKGWSWCNIFLITSFACVLLMKFFARLCQCCQNSGPLRFSSVFGTNEICLEPCAATIIFVNYIWSVNSDSATTNNLFIHFCNVDIGCWYAESFYNAFKVSSETLISLVKPCFAHSRFARKNVQHLWNNIAAHS